MNATSLNLPLNKNLGLAYVIAYKGTPSFQIGYKGFIQLAVRSGAFLRINACEIREGEINRNKITGEVEILGDFPNNKIIGYMAYMKLKNGFEASIYSSEEQIEAHAKKYSKSYGYDISQGKRTSKWSDKDERPKMALKTVIKRLLSSGKAPLSTELAQAITEDVHDDSKTNSQRNSFAEAQIIEQNDEPEIVKI